VALAARDDPDDENAQVAPLAHLTLTRPLVLVGMMGSGKSTIGRRLAQRLGVGFVDADEEIELAAGLSIAEIFAKLGEPVFRDGERRVLARLITDVPRVIATGGGAFIHDDTRALILARTDSVWLDAPVDVLVERTARRNTRPLLQAGDPRETLATLLAMRAPVYAQAAIHIASGRQPHDRTVEQVIEKMLGLKSATAVQTND
jgi:shikimate kinase